MEMMIAAFVLTVGITGALNLIVSVMRNSMNTRNAVIASGLAQEGIELIRNIRDNNMLFALSDLSIDPELCGSQSWQYNARAEAAHLS